jgi:hypothetical protein
VREKTIYICDICNGSYVSKEIAQKCEDAGLPTHFDEFVGKWLMLPLQTFINHDTLESSTMDSIVEWFPVRVESNTITSPQSYDFLSQIKLETIAHSLKMSTRSFKSHFILKEFLDYAIIVGDNYTEKLNGLLVKHELERETRTDETPTQELKDLIEEILKDKDLPPLEGVEKYEYKSSK